MGKTKGPYNIEFPKGTLVRVANRDALTLFLKEWKYHHKLEPEQIDFADHVAIVETVSVYHGGDELYTLEGIPGIWHEECLGKADIGNEIKALS